jgi:hypothetical protein
MELVHGTDVTLTLDCQGPRASAGQTTAVGDGVPTGRQPSRTKTGSAGVDRSGS